MAKKIPAPNLPIEIVPKGSLTPLRDSVGTNIGMWPREILMSLHDFKATKKASSWATYEVALRDFFRFLASVGLRSPVDVTRTHLTSYIDFLRKDGYADRTIQLYCSAASSFFDFLARPVDTKGTAIILSNPWKSVRDALPTVRAYERADNLREFVEDEYQKLLRTCDLKTVIGKRDYAIMTTTLWTCRRRQEIARIKVQDFMEQDGKIFIRFIQKGGHPILIDLTPEIMEAVKDYWRASGRNLKPQSPAWVATTDAGKYLNQARNLKVKTGEQPLSPSALDGMIKSRGAQAGLDDTVVDIHMHGLRHLGARIMRKLGKDLKEIKERLGHANLKTTDIYLGSMDRVGSEGLQDFAKIVMGR